MDLFDLMEQKVLKCLNGEEKLDENPNSDRFTFLGNEKTIIKKRIEECKVWYFGDSNELLNFYTAQETYGNAENPIYNRNKQQYYWGTASQEKNVKRIHSGVPNAITTTLVNIIGTPKIKCIDREQDVEEIVEKTKLKNIINQEQMPMTLALGWGAFKPVIDESISKDMPLIEWYNADDVRFVVKHKVIVGIIYLDYYAYDDNKYVLVEVRRKANGNSYIEYSLYQLNEDNTVNKVPLSTLPSTENLPEDGIVIQGLDKVAGVPSIFFFDVYNQNYGRSIFTGKIDLFDDLDQDLSQASQTSRVSTPVEYFPIDLIERGENGEVRLPKLFNRQYIASNAFPNGDGESGSKIETTQPQLNFEQYNEKCLADLNFILTGLLSPATLGLNIAKDDTALSQREKEKISIMTRDNVVDREQSIIRELIEICLIFKDYMTTGTFNEKTPEISVEFEDFANPSFESLSGTLLPLFNAGAISTEMFVKRLYGDSLSKEDKQKEIEAIEKNKQIENDFLNGMESLDGQIENDMDTERPNEERVEEVKQ